MLALQMIALGRKLTNLYHGLSAPICRRYGISQTAFDVLLFCANNPEHNTARDLCAIRGIKSGIASVAVESLIQDGLLTRESDPHDRRIRRLIPTDRTKAIIADGREMQAYFTGALRRGATEEEEAALTRFADRLAANLAQLEQGDHSSC